MKTILSYCRWAGLAWVVSLAAQVNVLTYHNDLARTGENLSETALTKAAVGGGQFGRLFQNPVDGYVYAQPLYVSGLDLGQKGVRNVVFVATEHDSVYAFDADSLGSPLWQANFLNPSNGVTTVPSANLGCSQITPEIGITSTPVIDLAGGTLYTVAMTLENGRYAHRLHALDLATGAERQGSPVLIEAVFPGTGEGGTTLTFEPKNYKQRPGLLLLNGMIYTAWSSHCDIGKYHGWVMAYDAKTLGQMAVYNNTPNGNQGSFWASGAAPAADAQGNIYLAAGNGSFNASGGGPNLGEAFTKMSGVGGALGVTDWFTPFNFADLNSKDLDIGSSGVLLLPDEAGSAQHRHLLVSAGKEGRIYLVDRDGMGHLQAGSDSQIPQSLTGAIGGLFGIPAYYRNTVYFAAENDNLKAFSIHDATLSSTPVSQSTAKFGFPGGAAPVVSANGSSDGIVWVLEPTGGGRVHAYDADDVSRQLFSAAIGSHVKFSSPTVANGKVYVGTQDSLVVFGLGPVVVNGADYQPGPVAPGSIVSIFGTFGAGTAAAGSAPLPNSLGGVSATLGGVAVPLFYVSGTQINAQVPYEIKPGQADLVIAINGAVVPTVSVSIQATAPAGFAAANQDGSLNTQQRPAAPGSVVTVYITGQGIVRPAVATGAAGPDALSSISAAVTATVGGQMADVLYAGLTPGLVGVAQVNVRVPAVGSGMASLSLGIGGVQSNPISVWVGI